MPLLVVEGELVVCGVDVFGGWRVEGECDTGEVEVLAVLSELGPWVVPVVMVVSGGAVGVGAVPEVLTVVDVSVVPVGGVVEDEECVYVVLGAW